MPMSCCKCKCWNKCWHWSTSSFKNSYSPNESAYDKPVNDKLVLNMSPFVHSPVDQIGEFQINVWCVIMLFCAADKRSILWKMICEQIFSVFLSHHSDISPEAGRDSCGHLNHRNASPPTETDGNLQLFWRMSGLSSLDEKVHQSKLYKVNEIMAIMVSSLPASWMSRNKILEKSWISRSILQLLVICHDDDNDDGDWSLALYVLTYSGGLYRHGNGTYINILMIQKRILFKFSIPFIPII